MPAAGTTPDLQRTTEKCCTAPGTSMPLLRIRRSPPYITPMATDSYIIKPDPRDPRLTERVTGIDQTGAEIETSVTVERALTIFLNAQEIVTAMTINDYPHYLALGYLLNQHMLLARRRGHRHRLRRGARGRGGAHQAQDQLREEAQEEGADLRLRPGHRVRRPDGGAGDRHAAGRGAAHLVALPPHPPDQHHALALSGGRRHSRLRARGRRPAARLHGGRRPPQRGRQDRRLDVPEPGAAAATRSSTPPDASPPRW